MGEASVCNAFVINRNIAVSNLKYAPSETPGDYFIDQGVPMPTKRSESSQGKKADNKPKPKKSTRKPAKKASATASKNARSRKEELDAVVDPQQAEKMDFFSCVSAAPPISTA